MSMQAKVAGDRRGQAVRDGLAFIDHDRQRYAPKVRWPNEAEILIGQYLEGGGTGPLGEFRIVLYELGDRRGRLHPQLCVFGDGAAALGHLLEASCGDLAGLLAPVADHQELSRRLLGVRDASDSPLPEGR